MLDRPVFRPKEHQIWDTYKILLHVDEDLTDRPRARMKQKKLEISRTLALKGQLRII